MPRVFEINRQFSRRKAAVRADGFKKIFHLRKIFLQNEIFGLVGFQNPVSSEFEPMISFSLKIR